MSLHSFIQSMSKSEKRYFKLHAQSGKKSTPKYLQLFDLINKQETYNEEVVKKKGFNPTDKNLLMEKLLDSIHIMNLHKTVDAELRLMLDYISILFNKKQWQLLGKYIRKAKQMATENEQFDILVEVLRWEQILWAYADKTNIEQKMDKAIERKAAVLEQFKDQVQYYDLSMRVELILRGDSMLKKPKAKKKFNEIASLPLLNETAKPLSAKATIDYAYMKLLYHRRREEDEQTLHYCRLLLKAFDENKFLFHLHDYPLFYVKIHFWEKAMCLKLNVETSTTPLQISNFPEQEQNIDLSHTIDIQNITYCIRALNRAEGKQHVLQAEQRWEGYTKSIRDTRLSILSYTIMIFYCLFEDWEKAQIWLDKLTVIHRATDRKDIQIAARLWQLIICYEREPFDLDKHVQSAYKYFVRNEHYFETEQQVLQFFRDLYKAATRSEKVVVWQKMSDFIEGKLKEEGSPQRGLKNLRIWCESKINRVSTVQWMQEQKAKEPLMYV